MTKLFLLAIGLIFMLYAIVKERRGRKNFYLIAYWKNLTPKGAAIYTLGLIITAIAIFSR